MNRPVNVLGRLSAIDVLLTVAKEGPLFISELVDTEARTQARTAVIVLENAGLITRDKTPEDLRYTFISLTPLGDKVSSYLTEINRLMGGEE